MLAGKHQGFYCFAFVKYNSLKLLLKMDQGFCQLFLHGLDDSWESFPPYL